MDSILADPEAPKRKQQLGPKAQAKLRRQENLRIWKLIIRDLIILIGHGIALILIGLGFLAAVITFIGIIGWGIYSLVIG